jgi:hypothetical protein
VLGRAGGDLLIGEGGADRLVGGAGSDALAGRGGRDVYAGGAGRDFILGKLAELDGDTILDFAPGDVIVVTGRRMAASAFALERLRGHAELRADADGDGDTDATLLLRGISDAPILAGMSPRGDPSYTVLQLGRPANRAANDLALSPKDALLFNEALVERTPLPDGAAALDAAWTELGLLAGQAEWM